MLGRGQGRASRRSAVGSTCQRSPYCSGRTGLGAPRAEGCSPRVPLGQNSRCEEAHGSHTSLPWPLRLSHRPPAKGCGEAARPVACPAADTARPSYPTSAQPARCTVSSQLRRWRVQQARVSQEPESGASEHIHPRTTVVRKRAIFSIPSAVPCL